MQADTAVLSSGFPIHEVMPAIQQCLLSHRRLVLEAPPGAGKTTQVPLALLQASWCAGKKILMLEPRRVAARAAAAYMAGLLGEEVGDTVGYRIRFDNKISARTRIEVLTEGILARIIQDDPQLDDVGVILFDEFHERHLSGDLGLALALDVQTGLRDDLRIVVMSATLDGDKLARFLDAERISSGGRSYPVTIQYVPPARHDTLPLALRRTLLQALDEHPGDVLVFMPGQREIIQMARLFEEVPGDSLSVITLFGDMPAEQQSKALAPDAEGRRRLVLATNIAETSVTLPGVRIVIDSGLAREPRFDPNSGFSRLETVAISQASADQRSGRAGRLAPGWSYRLWPQSQRLNPQRSAEICTVDLTSLALELAAWGSSDLRFVDTPPPGALAAARDLLQKLGALDRHQRITPLGTRMLSLGTHPRIAAMLLSCGGDECAVACDLAALIDARDPLKGYRGDDWHTRWLALADFRQTGAGRHASGERHADISRAAFATIARTAAQWRRRMHLTSEPPRSLLAHQLGDRLLHAWPDRIARQHAANPGRYQLGNGRSARLGDESRLCGEPWLVVTELRHEPGDSLILRAAPLDETILHASFPDRFVVQDSVRWDESSRSLVSRRETFFDQILLDSKPAGRPDAALAAQALCDAIAGYGLDCLPWSDSLRQWHARVMGLRQWMPELKLPDLSSGHLLASRNEWLLPALHGKTRMNALSETELASALQAGIDWHTRQLIDTHAPQRIRVPSGLERPIQYAPDAPPVLAVKLQELFGLNATPRIADGRVPLTLHLLSPGGKPLQITRDLQSFWARTYPEVKKEMKGRYPRHPWPDDPWNATATHRAKPRGT